MILGFSTQINDKPTYFVEKIHKGFRLKELIMKAGIDPQIHYPPNYNFVAKDNLHHKLHTIREDKNDRWNAGMKIDFFINCRQKDMFRFAPVLPVMSVQSVYMSYAYNDIIEISINGRQLHDKNKILEFVHNDGFDTWKEFFDYFYPIIKRTKDNWFTGKIIHWTELKY